MDSFKPLRAALLALVLGASALAAQATPSAAEGKLIDTLIQRVSQMSAMVFVRNGSEYNAADAAKHMQAKYDHFRKELVTAEDFIERCASRSEMTGQAYKVKLAGGTVRDANEFLNNELRALRQGTPKPSAAVPSGAP
jgi:predicted RNA-binding protein with PIN domain